jgi:hypothetical protein
MLVLSQGVQKKIKNNLKTNYDGDDDMIGMQ